MNESLGLKCPSLTLTLKLTLRQTLNEADTVTVKQIMGNNCINVCPLNSIKIEYIISCKLKLLKK